jgi:hypothetical protein
MTSTCASAVDRLPFCVTVTVTATVDESVVRGRLPSARRH